MPRSAAMGEMSGCMREEGLQDGKASGEGVFSRQTSRNVPSVLNAAFKTTLHWDGNPTTLEQQLKYPLSGFAEMNLRSYDDLTASIRARADYVAAFRSEMGVAPADIERWDALRERVQRIGLRNSLLVAVAPTATIASIAGCRRRDGGDEPAARQRGTDRQSGRRI